MSAAARYAIYFVPAAESALYRFGSATLGYDCYTGEVLKADIGDELGAAGWAELTAEPRRYGFHATLKAPFRLREGADEAELLETFRRFAAAAREVPVMAPRVAELAGFIAVIPGEASAPLNSLADACVMEFDHFRAPLTEAERARRLRAPLSGQQIAYLERWGYPYVFSEFRFHMTLTDGLEPGLRGRIGAMLRDRFTAARVGDAVAVDRLALMRQDSPSSSFRVRAHAPISAVAAANKIGTSEN